MHTATPSSTKIFTLTRDLGRAQRIEDVFELAMQGFAEVLAVERCSILLFDAGGVMRFVAWRGLSYEYRRAVEGHSPWPRGERRPSPVLVPDVHATAGLEKLLPVFERESIRALGFFPITTGAELLGKFMLYYDAPRDFAGDEVELAQTIADHLGCAVERFRFEEVLRESSRRKDDFLAMLGHELRNPLAGISLALDLMERETMTAAVARLHSTCRRQTDNLVRLVDDVLDVSRVTRGKVVLRRSRIDPVAAAQAAIGTVQAKFDAGRQELSLEARGGPFIVDADPTRLEQVLSNLLANAAKFTAPCGRVWMRIGTEPRAGVDQVVIEIEDTGEGIAPELLPHLFGLFVQGGQSLDRPTGGLGIGLTLVKSLMELHGGGASAHSAGPGRGSTFRVWLPLAPPAALEVAPAPPAEAEAAPGPRTGRRRIVLVEDDDDVRFALRELLLHWGHEVETAGDGLAGRDLILARRPDVAFVDLGLPGIDGYELARQIRAAPEAARVRLVALSGYTGAEVTAEVLRAGYERFLAKPLAADQLLSTLS